MGGSSASGCVPERSASAATACAASFGQAFPQAEGERQEEALLRYDETNPALSYLLCQLRHPEFPVPIGVFRAVEQESYEAAVHRQIAEARAARKPGTLDDLLRQGEVWQAGGATA